MRFKAAILVYSYTSLFLHCWMAFYKVCKLASGVFFFLARPQESIKGFSSYLIPSSHQISLHSWQFITLLVESFFKCLLTPNNGSMKNISLLLHATNCVSFFFIISFEPNINPKYACESFFFILFFLFCSRKDT